MPERRQDGPRILYEHDAPPADAGSTVDVTGLLTRLAERTAELAEARVRQKQAEANLKKKTRELNSERKAHRETRRQLESDCRELETECHQAAAACRQLEADVAEQRDARAAAEAELKRAQERGAALQHQLQVVWAELQQHKPEGPQPWWRRFGS
jgi:chromosome segregation ATPase